MAKQKLTLIIKSELIESMKIEAVREKRSLSEITGFLYQVYIDHAKRTDAHETDQRAMPSIPVLNIRKLVEQILGRPVNHKDIDMNLQDQLESLLKTLTPREERIIEMFYGLTPGGESHTVQEIADRLGVTRSPIYKQRHRALRKMKHPSRRRLLRRWDQEES